MSASHRWTWTGLAVLLVVAPCPAAESFADLVRRVPEAANAVLLLDAAALRESPFGRREGWATNHERSTLGDAGGLPPGVERLVVAAQINPCTLDHVWKVGIAATRSPVSPEQLARAEGGTPDTLAYRSVVLSPRNAYYVILDPQVVGAMHPANRQELSRWLRSGPAGRGPSDYLRAATATPNAPITLALDTTDVFDPPGLRAKLSKCKALAGRGADELQRVAQALAGLKGVRLSVRVGTKLDGELRLDGDGADALAPVAKALVLEALGSMSAAVEDLDDWSARASGGAVVLSGPLTERGLRQLLSPLLSPVVMSPAAAASPTTGGTPASPQGQAATSQMYFRSVTKLLKDLQQQRLTNYNTIAQVYQRYAQQIDELPLLGVDAELLKWGGDVSATLRSLATLAKTTKSQKGIAAMNYYAAVSQGSSTATDAWGYQYTVPTTTVVNTNVVGQINNLMATEGANELAIRSQTWNNIDTATAQVRRKMTEKYMVEF